MDTVEFGALYERYAPDVLRFALFLSGSPAEAEDIVSETFVRAWIGSGELRVGTLKAYLLMIARNLHLDRRRHDARSAELPSEIADPGPGPDAISESRGDLRAVLAALQTLPEVDRAALLMRAVDGLGYQEIAATLGLTTVAARVKVHRSRVRLTELCIDKETR